MLPSTGKESVDICVSDCPLVVGVHQSTRAAQLYKTVRYCGLETYNTIYSHSGLIMTGCTCLKQHQETCCFRVPLWALLQGFAERRATCARQKCCWEPFSDAPCTTCSSCCTTCIACALLGRRCTTRRKPPTPHQQAIMVSGLVAAGGWLTAERQRAYVELDTMHDSLLCGR